jgi:hypothetical protein
MAVAGHQVGNVVLGSTGLGGSIGGVEFKGDGINNFISGSTTTLFFTNFTGFGGTVIYKQNTPTGDVLAISSTPATITISGVTGLTYGSPLSVWGNPTTNVPNTTGSENRSISAGTVDTVLNRSGSTLIWSQTRTACYGDNTVTYAKFQQIDPYSVVGNSTMFSANTTSVPLIFVYDNQQQQYKNTANGIDEINSVSIYSIISSFTGSNVDRNYLPEYTSFASFIGTRTIPTNFLVKGKTIRLKGKGYSQAGSAGPVFLDLRLIDTGNTSTRLVSANTSVNTGGPLGFSLEVDITCREIGSSGLVNVNGFLHNSLGYSSLLNISSVTIDTTKQYYLQISGNTGAADRIFALTHTTIEILN